MADRIYEEGFPDRWSMVHRDDCTLLCHRGDMSFMGGRTAICAAPKLMQGEAWLSTAKAIAHAMAETHKRETDRILDEFCDSCGIGPPYDENDKVMMNVRSTTPWRCDRCGYENTRPKNRDTDG